jgi:hypothetical protein
MNSLWRVVILSWFALNSFVPVQAAVAVGQPFPAYTVQDAFGKVHTLAAGSRGVIVSAEKDVSARLHAWLSAQPADFLAVRRVEYVSDITPMPGVITRLFALPKMRKYPYRILLADDPKFAQTYPAQPGKVAVFLLDGQGQLTAIHHVVTAAEVEALLPSFP